MSAFAPGQARGLIRRSFRARSRGSREARAASPGLRSFFKRGAAALCCTLFASAGCTPNPRDVAAAADRAGRSGVYTWLADHDPSAVMIAGLDARTVHAVAPDARIISGSPSAASCARALHERALLAAIARTGSPERARLEDCGYAIFRDEASIVVAPR